MVFLLVDDKVNSRYGMVFVILGWGGSYEKEI